LAPEGEKLVAVRVGIMGVNGYGGSELLRLSAAHPGFEITRAYGESTVGQSLAQRFPGLLGLPLGDVQIERFDAEALEGVDLLFASLPTGQSKEPLAKVPSSVKILDVGGDHRFAQGWEFGVTELPGARERIAASSRVANPGCYSCATILALAPLVAEGLIETEGIVVDAKSGVSGAGRGGGSSFGYSDTNEDLVPYGLTRHAHVPEIKEALTRLTPDHRRVTLAFTPHLVPMTRGLLATCYARPVRSITTEQLLEVAHSFYAGHPFVRVVPYSDDLPGGGGPHTKWASGSNFEFLCYVVNPDTGLIVAMGAEDNLGKGAAGQAIQNANLMTGQPETTGLMGMGLVP
jgi:N-acetyl-gamma-glutamyl-phosphate reductase